MSFIKKIASKLPSRTIYRRTGEKYLTRYYIFRKPRKWLPSVYIHCFHASDADMELHSHPWKGSFSVILKGQYREEYRTKNFKVKDHVLTPGCINLVGANKFHRIDILSDQVWTLFISGPKTQRWGFWNRNSGQYWDWEEFEELKTHAKH